MLCERQNSISKSSCHSPTTCCCLQAVYGVLKEAEHRSTFYIPYWKVPLARALVPRQRKFAADLAVINECLDGLITLAKETRSEGDEEALQARDYDKAILQPLASGNATMCLLLGMKMKRQE